MATPINELPVEIAQGDLETRYVELGDMAIRHARCGQINFDQFPRLIGAA